MNRKEESLNEPLYPKYHNGKLNVQVRNFLYELSKGESTPLRSQTIVQVREGNSVSGLIRERDKAFVVYNVSIPGKDGFMIPLRIYVPKGEGPFPVLVYLHGGGWVFGTLDEADHLCHHFAAQIPAVVVSVDYRLSPEYKYPCALEDVYTALVWINQGIAGYKGKPNVIAVAGESAGANLATVATQMARDWNGPSICFQLLLCPCVDLVHLNTQSYQLFGEGRWLSKLNIEYYYEQYLENKNQAGEAYVSPLLAENLKNLPSAHVITAEFDILRDEGEAYVSRLREAGNVVTHRRYDGMIHSFFVLNKVFDMANAAMDEWVDLLRRNLHRG